MTTASERAWKHPKILIKVGLQENTVFPIQTQIIGDHDRRARVTHMAACATLIRMPPFNRYAGSKRAARFIFFI